jgi:hypothetical protein
MQIFGGGKDLGAIHTLVRTTSSRLLSSALKEWGF